MLVQLILIFMGALPLVANPYGNELQLFFPNSDSVDFLSVESGKILKERQFNLGFFIDRSTNTLPRRLAEGGEVDADRKISNIQDDIYHSTLSFAYGYNDYLSFGTHLNLSSDSNIKVPDEVIYKQDAGINDVFIHMKTKFVDSEYFKSSFMIGVGYDTLKDNPYIDQDRPLYYSSTLAMSLESHLIKWALNAGYKYREIADVPMLSEREIPPMSDKYFFSSGLSIGSGVTRIIAEIYHSITSQQYQQQSDRVEEASETLIGAKFSYKDHSFFVANATEIKHGLSTADNRLMLGYTFHPILEKPPEPPEPVVDPVEEIIEEIAKPEEAKPKEVKPEPPKPVETDLTSIFENIRFMEGSSTIIFNTKTREAFDRLSNYLKSESPGALLITGHTDDKGSHELNLRLSLSRARAVKSYLNAKGFAHIKITAIGMGEDRPIADNKSPEGRETNRRVEVKAFKDVVWSH